MSTHTDAAGTALNTRRQRRSYAGAPQEEPETQETVAARRGRARPAARPRAGGGPQALGSGASPSCDLRADQARSAGAPRSASEAAVRHRRSARRDPGRSGRRSRPPRVQRRLRGSSARRVLQRLRIPVALLVGICAVGAGILAGGETQVETATAVQVSSPVAAGQTLTAADLEETQVDVAAVPDQQAQLDQLLGRQVAVPLPAGALVHQEHLVGPGLLEGQEDGVVAVPVRPADTAIVGMLTPGQTVDVLVSADSAESGSSSRTVAAAAPVLWTPTSEDENWLPGAGEAGNVVIVAVEAETAEAIAEATHEGRLHLSLVGRQG
ncbi:RcpC/CpaB family pilus assembly protein [Nesterenkonia lacusekhoensis]|uniref:Flp pilus assembly protein CpaB n=1 Tax=Nesterenkonia lacusekhoensis TaxID=150832 RepID=A0ABS4SZI6_9MICC|nr:RcpC/CpaB family pilus assembly protein [Nesterenkonia lacusekhoensis]MBP2317563.1 Flp pilus assembly protein CpaB [Nesterenkonia lacusekhoensis]